MGTWNVNITGNDTAQDLKQEYNCAFFYYKDVNEAVRKIEEYAAKYGIDKADEEEYCAYFYSLADYMWKKGILTDDVRDRAIDMIDSSFGLDIWKEAGDKILKKRKDVLEKFREQLLSPMGERKKIRINTHMNEIFENGDLIAIKLITAGKNYSKDAARTKEISPERFASLDGKYVFIQKIGTHVSWRSRIVPEVRDCWAIFRLFDGIYDEAPVDVEFDELSDALFSYSFTPYFTCESSMFYFKKRKYEVLGNYPLPADVIDGNEDYIKFQYRRKSVYFGIYNYYNDADSDMLAAMGNELVIKEYVGEFPSLREIITSAYNNNNVRDHSDASREEAEVKRAAEVKILCEIAEKAFKTNGKTYQMLFNGKMIGFIQLDRTHIKSLYVMSGFQKKGVGKRLVKYSTGLMGGELKMEVPDLISGKRIMPRFVSITDILNKICKDTNTRIKYLNGIP